MKREWWLRLSWGMGEHCRRWGRVGASQAISAAACMNNELQGGGPGMPVHKGIRGRPCERAELRLKAFSRCSAHSVEVTASS